MVSVLAATNLIETLAVITICSLSFLNFFLVYILKLLVVRSLYAKVIRHDSRFVHYENGFFFWLTWFGACFVTSLLFSISFSEIYNTTDVVDGAPYILSLYVVYLGLMTLWALVQYVWVRQSAKLAFFLIFLVYLVTVFNIVLVFRLPESHWEHFLVLLLLVPPTFAIFATNAATTFRIDILHTIQTQTLSGKTIAVDTTATVYQNAYPVQKQFHVLPDSIPMHISDYTPGDGR
jgi:hypothetical protein